MDERGREMVKHHKRERNKTQPFVQIKHYEYKCAAFNALSGDEFKIYFEMRTRYNGRNNGEIVYSNRQAGECIDKTHPVGGKALRRLAQLGFIKVTKNYGYSQKRLAREYEITAISLTPATKANRLPDGSKDFLRWTQADIDRLKEQETQALGRSKKTKHRKAGLHTDAKIVRLEAIK